MASFCGNNLISYCAEHFFFAFFDCYSAQALRAKHLLYVQSKSTDITNYNISRVQVGVIILGIKQNVTRYYPIASIYVGRLQSTVGLLAPAMQPEWYK